MNIDRWFELIITELKSQKDVEIAHIDERTTSFAKGETVLILHAVSGHTATLAPSISEGGVIMEGGRLVNRVQYLPMRNFSIDELSFRDVASRISADLEE